MGKPILIGCSNVKVTGDVDVSVIGVSNAEYDANQEGMTIIRESLQISESAVNISVPVTIAAQPRSVNVSTTTTTSDPNIIVYFCDTSSNNITITVYDTSKHITVIKTSTLNLLTIVPDTGSIDGTSSINITYLSPKDVYFDGTNFWSK